MVISSNCYIQSLCNIANQNFTNNNNNFTFTESNIIRFFMLKLNIAASVWPICSKGLYVNDLRNGEGKLLVCFIWGFLG